LSARALVTGGGGFVGQWLARLLIARGDHVILAGLGDGMSPEILNAGERNAAQWVSLDIRRDDEIRRALQVARPDLIVHLAGVSFVPEAGRDPAAAYDVNALGVVRLLEGVLEARDSGHPDPTILVVGSATQYGAHPVADMPLTEDAAQRPASVYAGSKLAQEVAALAMHREHGLRVICTRSFNHSGIGHDRNFLLPALVRRIRALSASGDRRLALGNDSVRDYLHVDDVVRAYALLLERGAPGEVYNVCSGVGVSARKIAEDVLLRAGVTADISTEPALVRSSDIPILIGSPAKLRRDTGWTPIKTHTDIIDDLLRANAPTD
jgi:GDP-4-dehydro-6-deoxy-D-mannose reductase